MHTLGLNSLELAVVVYIAVLVALISWRRKYNSILIEGALMIWGSYGVLLLIAALITWFL
jgi:hypothetical protein